MPSARGPVAPARICCEIAVRALPQLDDRLRYRAEFRADLTALTPVAQLRYATGVLAQAFALRAALGSSPTRAEEAAMSLTTRSRVPFWRCRVFRSHAWIWRNTEDGGHYMACRHCGRERGTGGAFFIA